MAALNVSVPGTKYEHALKTLEFTPQEPGLFENKYYVRDIGNVSTIDLDTNEAEVLVKVEH